MPKKTFSKCSLQTPWISVDYVFIMNLTFYISIRITFLSNWEFRLLHGKKKLKSAFSCKLPFTFNKAHKEDKRNIFAQICNAVLKSISCWQRHSSSTIQAKLNPLISSFVTILTPHKARREKCYRVYFPIQKPLWLNSQIPDRQNAPC